MADSSPLPPPFLHRMHALLGGQFPAFQTALHGPPPVSIRYNAAKPVVPVPADGPVPWAANAVYLPQRPVFAVDPLWHTGTYYVQEASSMFLEQAWRAVEASVGETPLVLDLCAAPGGKSTHLAALLPPGGLLVANEVIRGRAQVLAENLTKWGLGNAVVTNSDPAAFGTLEGVFDLVLVDAPCSGEGMFRKDPEAAGEWSEAHVKLCADRQRRILSEVWPALKPGGFLVYSTCTYNHDENESQLDWLADCMGAQGVPVPADDAWGLVPAQGGLPGHRFYPHRLRGEGLFMAVVRKPDGRTAAVRLPKKPVWSRATRRETDSAAPWLRQPDAWDWLRWQEKLVALPAGTHPVAERLAAHLRIVQAGLDVAERIRDESLPLPALALSAHLQAGAFAAEEVALEAALRFLKKEDVPLTEGRGWKLITFQNQPLGWVKQIGHRANNYYPSEWRLRLDWREVEKRM